MTKVQELPTEYVAGRFYVRPITDDGSPLLLFTDTGGGLFLRQSTVSRLNLPTETVTHGNDKLVLVAMPTFKPEASIPTVSIPDDPRSQELRGRLFVYSDDKCLNLGDGMLGQLWFGGRVWTFDYPGQRLLLHLTPSPSSGAASAVTPLGFPTDSAGRRSSHFPSIEATIDGETYAFLFDTGATVRLSDPALADLGGPPEQATCFVTAWLFDRWRHRHAGWKVIEHADLNAGGQPMMEVPFVTIAGLEAGPTWFTRRPDANFHEFMTSMMDRRVEGALGGSLLQYFVVTVDYPQGIATFAEQRSLNPRPF